MKFGLRKPVKFAKLSSQHWKKKKKKNTTGTGEKILKPLAMHLEY